MTARQIAIDGPAGAGKSTVARLVAGRLGYLYIDTGAMYRAVAWAALEQGVAVEDEAALAAIAANPLLRLEAAEDGCRVWYGERDISQEIRLPQVGNMASPVSAHPEVRRALVARQQEMASSQPVVMDGRDIGTVVLPQAECKIFLTASPRIRAERRWAELAGKGIAADVEQIRGEIEERDQRDSNRAASPLRQAEDAYLLDSSYLTIDQVVEGIIKIAEAK